MSFYNKYWIKPFRRSKRIRKRSTCCYGVINKKYQHKKGISKINSKLKDYQNGEY